jgi:hypothetical protein
MYRWSPSKVVEYGLSRRVVTTPGAGGATWEFGKGD